MYKKFWSTFRSRSPLRGSFVGFGVNVVGESVGFDVVGDFVGSGVVGEVVGLFEFRSAM